MGENKQYKWLEVRVNCFLINVLMFSLFSVRARLYHFCGNYMCHLSVRMFRLYQKRWTPVAEQDNRKSRFTYGISGTITASSQYHKVENLR